jgi:uncharacterized membrane protein
MSRFFLYQIHFSTAEFRVDRTPKEIAFYCVGYYGFPVGMLGLYIGQPILAIIGGLMIATGTTWYLLRQDPKG